MENKRVALVIGSGAVKCSAALGVWKVLQRAGVPIDLFVGCSGGSLFAALMALGFELNDCIDKTQLLWNRHVTEKRNWPSILSAILPQIFKFDELFGMMDDRTMLANLKTTFGELTFRDCRSPLFVAATDFHTGEQVVLSEGKLLDALRASIAIPYIWSPWPVGNRLLVDGSVSDPMPVDIAIKEDSDLILAVGFESPFPRKVKSISRFAFHVNSLMTNNLLRANFAFHNLAHHAEILTIMPEFDHPISLFDTDQFPYVIAEGERAMEEQLPYLNRLLVKSAL